jgi:hypothetical protein
VTVHARGWPSMNPRLHQSELKMEAADGNVTLHFSIHLRMAGRSPLSVPILSFSREEMASVLSPPCISLNEGRPAG